MKTNKITRARACKLLANGASLAQFTEHPNYHVRSAAFMRSDLGINADPATALEQFKNLRPNHFARAQKLKRDNLLRFQESERVFEAVERTNAIRQAAYEEDRANCSHEEIGDLTCPELLPLPTLFVSIPLETIASNNTLARRFLSISSVQALL